MLIERNTDKANLGEHLKKLMAHTDNLDMLVGFFYFSGVKVIVDQLKERKNMTMRVLVGMDADIIVQEIVEICQRNEDKSNDAIRQVFYTSMRKVMQSSYIDTQEFYNRLDIFIQMIQEGRLEIRKTRNPNHAKLYIFSLDNTQVAAPKVWITGSSNFSMPGLATRDEFNVQVADFGQEKVQEYFDALWSLAVPLTETEEQKIRILKLIDESVAASITPYEAYILVLREYLTYQKAVLNEERLNRILSEAKFTKYRYQVDAVAQAMNKLDEYRGVILADVVGLGKSIIASLLGALRGRRGLIICPPGLIGNPTGNDGGWNEYKTLFHLHDWEIWSRGQLDKIKEKLIKDPDFDMIIVDEAHNFRNEDTESYQILEEICFGREVILLTATPFNNKPDDLAALMKLFTPAKNSSFGDIESQFKAYSVRYKTLSGLSKAISQNNWDAIQSYLKKLNKEECGTDIQKVKELSSGLAKTLARDVRQIVEKVVIRRNRLDLSCDPDYAEEITTLSTLEEPQEQFFELTDEQDAFYDRVIEEYFGENGRFHGAIYRPQLYLNDQEGLDDSQNNIYYILRSQFVQRFESSFGAFRKSIENVRSTIEKSIAFINKYGYFIYDRAFMEKLSLLDDDADIFTAILEESAKRSASRTKMKKKQKFDYSIDDEKFDGERFRKHVEEDLKLMDDILEEIDNINLLNDDPKAKELVNVIESVLNGTHQDVVYEQNAPKRKILLFSTYKDTIHHISDYVKERFPNRVIIVDGDNFNESKAKEVKTNFDASFEKQEDSYDILLTTDKMSEGFNLNRAGLVINYDIPWNPTRVIQRVGRINRIGRKLFDSLYIFNFFPTKKGASIADKRNVAQNKMFTIHRILGEDSQIFSSDETPSASRLYDKLCSLDEGDASFYTYTKQRYAMALKFLKKSHPETLERLDSFSPYVKTAWKCHQNHVHATFLFRRVGATFSVIAHTNADREIREWTLEEALEQIRCEFNEPREEFTDEFWKYSTRDNKDKGPKGIYDALKKFKPAESVQQNKIPDQAIAVNGIHKRMKDLPYELQNFARAVAEDIQSFGTLSIRRIRELSKCAEKDGQKALESLIQQLTDLRKLRGENYLEEIRQRVREETVLVTIEKH